MIVLKILADIEPEKMSEFEQALGYILENDACPKSCIGKHVYRDWYAQNMIIYIEEWKTREDLKSRLKSDRFKSLVGAMKVLGSIRQTKIFETVPIGTLESVSCESG